MKLRLMVDIKTLLLNVDIIVFNHSISTEKTIVEIFLINPPQVFTKAQMATGIILPLGLLCLGAVCRRKGA